jgi:hypothetical protein
VYWQNGSIATRWNRLFFLSFWWLLARLSSYEDGDFATTAHSWTWMQRCGSSPVIKTDKRRSQIRHNLLPTAKDSPARVFWNLQDLVVFH